jgi:hypothetical protein
MDWTKDRERRVSADRHVPLEPTDEVIVELDERGEEFVVDDEDGADDVDRTDLQRVAGRYGELLEEPPDR